MSNQNNAPEECENCGCEYFAIYNHDDVDCFHCGTTHVKRNGKWTLKERDDATADTRNLN